MARLFSSRAASSFDAHSLLLSLYFVYVFSLPYHDSSSSSELIVNVQDQLAQVFIYITSIGVEALCDVLECLKEAIKIHLGVLAAPDHVLVNDVVVRLADVRVCHVFELGETLKLIRGDKVIVLLTG